MHCGLSPQQKKNETAKYDAPALLESTAADCCRNRIRHSHRLVQQQLPSSDIAHKMGKLSMSAEKSDRLGALS